MFKVNAVSVCAHSSKAIAQSVSGLCAYEHFNRNWNNKIPMMWWRFVDSRKFTIWMKQLIAVECFACEYCMGLITRMCRQTTTIFGIWSDSFNDKNRLWTPVAHLSSSNWVIIQWLFAWNSSDNYLCLASKCTNTEKEHILWFFRLQSANDPNQNYFPSMCVYHDNLHIFFCRRFKTL